VVQTPDPQFLRYLESQGLITIAPGYFDVPVRGVVCEDCQQHMLEVDGCVPSVLIIDGQEHERIPYNPEDLTPGERETHRCHDCGARPGAIHHFGCDMEICPKCGEQAAFCGCVEAVDAITANG
jgi:hypothetical protein